MTPPGVTLHLSSGDLSSEWRLCLWVLRLGAALLLAALLTVPLAAWREALVPVPCVFALAGAFLSSSAALVYTQGRARAKAAQLTAAGGRLAAEARPRAELPGHVV